MIIILVLFVGVFLMQPLQSMSNYRFLFVIALALGITPLVGCNSSEVSETPTESTAPEASQASDLDATETQLEVMVSIPHKNTL